jgi:hypothetical protein
MENTLQILQTIGICVGAIAECSIPASRNGNYTVIAILAFTLWISFFPALTGEDEESESFPEEEEEEEKRSNRRWKRSLRKR